MKGIKMKRAISSLLCIIMLLSTAVFAEENGIDKVLDSTAKYLYDSVPEPSISEIGGEWTVLALAENGREVPEEYFNTYLKNAEEYVKEIGGVLSDVKYTEYSRLILALTALERDASSFAGFDLTAPLFDFEKTVYQGLNGAAWALIALDRGGIEGEEIREKYLSFILEREIEGGGWALSANSKEAEADITAMTLTALKNYDEKEEVKTATQRGIACLSAMQSENGGFLDHGEENAESAAWALIALSAWDIPYSDARFVKNKNTLYDNLLSFYNEDGGFSHIKNAPSNLMATEQAALAFISLKRFEENKPHIFSARTGINLNDEPVNSEENEKFLRKHPDVKKSAVIYPEKTFTDIGQSAYKEKIEALTKRGIINGKGDESFDPGGTMTRAEFASIVVKALCLPERTGKEFADVNTGDWFYSAVNTASAYGIVSGESENTFDPNGKLSREEAAVIITRASSLAGLDTKIADGEARDVLAEFTDYISASSWAMDALAFCCKAKILDRSATELAPTAPALREQVADMVYNMLREAELL